MAGKAEAQMTPTLTSMDYIRSALCNAAASGLDLGDVLEMAIHAETPEAFDDAINMLGCAAPTGSVWIDGQWIGIE